MVNQPRQRLQVMSNTRSTMTMKVAFGMALLVVGTTALSTGGQATKVEYVKPESNESPPGQLLAPKLELKVAELQTRLEAKDAELQAKRDKALDLLAAIPEVTCPKPGGAFYLFPCVAAYIGRSKPNGEVVKDATQLCLYLLEEFRVALVPGEAFGAPGCIRLSYAATMENITDAITKLGECLKSLKA